MEGAAAMGIPMSQGQVEQFNTYHEMLVEANARMNLTRVPEDPAEAVDRNYLDCVAPLAGGFPAANTAVDVGSGAGFPGIPLAIMLPDIRFTLVDALGKRVDFLKTVIDRLGLNAEALHLRAEDAARRATAPSCRAYSPARSRSFRHYPSSGADKCLRHYSWSAPPPWGFR
jgi:16S rRNA (guanine527-N7)-methyltransferase